MEQFFVILQQLFMFAFFSFVGAWCVKKKIFDEAALNSMSRFIITVTIPFMLICNLLSGPSLADLMTSLPIFLVYFFVFVFLFLLSCFIVRFFGFDEKKRDIYKALTTFSNAGFIGIPLILALFGKEGAIFVSLTTIVDQLMLWTLGIKLTSSANKFEWKRFLNPALVAILFSLVGIVLGFRLPKIVFSALSPIGNMTTALSMIYIGGLFCVFDIKKYLLKVDIYMLILFKMILFPALIWCILKFMPISVNMAKTVTLLFALPCMTSIAIFAKKYDNNPEYAVATILISTAFSIVTVPLISILIG